MNFSDFSDGGTPAWHDYVVGYADGDGAGSDRRWLRSTLGYMTAGTNEMALRITQLGYDDVGTIPIGSTEQGFNELFIDDYSSTNVTKGIAVFTTYLADGSASNWGSSNSLTEKICANFEARVFTPPTGSPGPHQPVGISSTARVAPGVGACPTLELFAANLIVLADSPVKTIIGMEIDAGGTSTVEQRIGVQIVSSGTTNGSNQEDVGYALGGNGSGGGQWDYGYSWYPDTFHNTSTILGTLHASPANIGIDFLSTTFTTAAFRSTGFLVGPAGQLHLGSLVDAVNDAAAAGGGVAVGQVYRNGSVLMVRVA